MSKRQQEFVNERNNFFSRMRGFKEECGGGHFYVAIYDKFVIKYPSPQYEDRVETIAKLQTELSEKMEEVLPCYNIGKYLFMPKAPGMTCERAMSKEEFEPVQERIRKKANSFGYDLPDIPASRNVFKDGDKYYVVDCNSIKKI